MEGDVHVGQRVLVYNKFEATVRFIGATKFAAGKWIGVECDKPIGKNDGSVQGTRYFQCKPLHGWFVHPSMVKPFHKDEKAAANIQSTFRAHCGRGIATRKSTLDAWNELDYQNENSFMQAQELSGNVDSVLQQQYPAYARIKLAPAAASVAVQQPVGYQGPNCDGPLTLADAHQLLVYLRTHPTYVLPVLVVRKILKQAVSLFTSLDTVQQVTVPTQSQLNVCGDVHGQLKDVLWIFWLNGEPSATNQYLFNGDIVDRGDNSVEIFLLLCVYKLACPTCVHINRGNHESAEMNTRPKSWGGGFAKEIQLKYGGGPIFGQFQSVFNALPLATIINNSVFVCHGGLFRKPGVTLSHLKKINRKRACPAVCRTFEDGLFFDLLWSDPQCAKGTRANAERGAGYVFGPDVTHKFLTENKLSLVVRSHQVPTSLRGYEVMHDKKLVTVFSASDYCGVTGNFGGVLIFRSNSDKYDVVEYRAPPLWKQAELATGATQGTSTALRAARDAEPHGDAQINNAKMEADVVSKLGEHVSAMAHDLHWYFTQADPHHTGRISRVVWRDALEAVIPLKNVPWLRFQPALTACENDSIDYNDFLNRYMVHAREDVNSGWQDALLRALVDAQLRYSHPLLQRLSTLAHDGMIEMDAVIGVVQQFASQLWLSQTQCVEFCRRLSLDSRVPLVNLDPKHSFPIDCSYIPDRLRSLLGLKLFAARDNVLALFRQRDTHNSGSLPAADIVTALRMLPVSPLLQEEDLVEVAMAAEAVPYEKFLQSIVPAPGSGWLAAAAVIQQICLVLYNNKIAFRRAFRYFDPEGDNTVPRDQFHAALDATNTLLASPMTQAQLRLIADSLRNEFVGQHRLIRYEEFLESFVGGDALGPVKSE
eukprot:TRINITY_DN4642_c0_g1_i1.p1 TRINITY_DN4642_c0_g1~~TRINITY_DN4642_c0_g1_i1.p1  ORF type:complete len:877 (+),score=183.98 TRINITY_DN4642_c0_g1_i1:133-2763(+)